MSDRPGRLSERRLLVWGVANKASMGYSDKEAPSFGGTSMQIDPGLTQGRTLECGERAGAAEAQALFGIDLAATGPAGFADMWQHVVDGLTEQIALLDEDWTILVVNQSWAKVAELYGHSALLPGTNYLTFCRELAATGLGIAIDVVAGIEEIAEGKRSSFQLIYRSSDPEVGHDHQLCVNRFDVGGRKFASITRYDVTRLLELRRLRHDFSESVLVSQADERRRIGRELHDSTMQLMVCLDLKIGQLQRSRATANCAPIIEEMRELLAETEEAIRSISYLTHPPLLGELSLPQALQALVEGFGRRTGLDVKFEVVGEATGLSPAADAAAYRIVQEALSNAHRHADARQVLVRLIRRNSIAHVVVADDGSGMPDVIRSGVGLAGMRSRLSELGGRLSIRSRAPGTAVVASIPVQPHPDRMRQ